MSIGDYVPVYDPLTASSNRPYTLIDSFTLPKSIEGCTFGFHITGPGWPPGRIWVGTTLDCGQHIVNAMNMAHNWGVRAGKLESVPKGE